MDDLKPDVARQDKILTMDGIVAAFVVTITYLTSWCLRVLAADDSYIHRRIAENLVHTGHAYFNPGEAVMATSSPLWTLLLAINKIFLPSLNLIPLYEAISVGIACYAGILLLGTIILDRPKLKWIPVCSVTFLIWILLLRSSIEQMETPLAVALLLSGIYGVSTRKVWGACFVVLAALTRYEFFSAALLFLAVMVWKKRLSVKSILLASISGGILTGWLWSQYHTLVPNTVRAKDAGYAISRSLTLRGLEIRPVTALLIGVGLSVILFTKRGDSRVPMLARLLMIAGCLIALLYIFKRTYIFPWYVPVYLVPLNIGLLLWGFTSTLRSVRFGIFIVICSFIAVSAKGSYEATVAALEGKPWKDTNDVPGLRVGEYMMLGRAIFDVCPDGTLMTSELGGLGIGFKGKILDGFGLVSPDAIKYHPMKIPEERSSGELGAIPVPFVLEKNPDIIVTYPQYGEDILRRGSQLGYLELSYPPLLPKDLSNLGSFYGIPKIYVLVKQGGRCSAGTIDASIKTKINNPNLQYSVN